MIEIADLREKKLGIWSTLLKEKMQLILSYVLQIVAILLRTQKMHKLRVILRILYEFNQIITLAKTNKYPLRNFDVAWRILILKKKKNIRNTFDSHPSDYLR